MSARPAPESRPGPRYLYRCAVTGRWVSRAYAEAHPDTTVRHARLAACPASPDRSPP